jgi:hypothetical protein
MRRTGPALGAIAALLLLVAPATGSAEDPYAPAPQTSIDSGPPGVSREARPTFTFSSATATATFECALEGTGFSPCSSPYTSAPLSQGTYTFRVRAIDSGNPDPTPAELTFSIDRNISGANASAQNVQRVRGRRVQLVVSVAASEHVIASASGEVRLGREGSFSFASQEASIEAGVHRRLILEPAKRAASHRIRKELKRGGKVSGVLTATFTDDIGNRATTGGIGIKLKD